MTINQKPSPLRLQQHLNMKIIRFLVVIFGCAVIHRAAYGGPAVHDAAQASLENHAKPAGDHVSDDAGDVHVLDGDLRPGGPMAARHKNGHASAPISRNGKSTPVKQPMALKRPSMEESPKATASRVENPADKQSTISSAKIGNLNDSHQRGLGEATGPAKTGLPNTKMAGLQIRPARSLTSTESLTPSFNAGRGRTPGTVPIGGPVNASVKNTAALNGTGMNRRY
jgi:hypothetical protein